MRFISDKILHISAIANDQHNQPPKPVIKAKPAEAKASAGAAGCRLQLSNLFAAELNKIVDFLHKYLKEFQAYDKEGGLGNRRG